MKTTQLKRYGTYLTPEHIKALKLYAIAHDMKDYEVLGEAVSAYLAKHTPEAN